MPAAEAVDDAEGDVVDARRFHPRTSSNTSWTAPAAGSTPASLKLCLHQAQHKEISQFTLDYPPGALDRTREFPSLILFTPRAVIRSSRLNFAYTPPHQAGFAITQDGRPEGSITAGPRPRAGSMKAPGFAPLVLCLLDTVWTRWTCPHLSKPCSVISPPASPGHRATMRDTSLPSAALPQARGQDSPRLAPYSPTYPSGSPSWSGFSREMVLRVADISFARARVPADPDCARRRQCAWARGGRSTPPCTGETPFHANLPFLTCRARAGTRQTCPGGARPTPGACWNLRALPVHRQAGATVEAGGTRSTLYGRIRAACLQPCPAASSKTALVAP